MPGKGPQPVLCVSQRTPGLGVTAGLRADPVPGTWGPMGLTEQSHQVAQIQNQLLGKFLTFSQLRLPDCTVDVLLWGTIPVDNAN